MTPELASQFRLGNEAQGLVVTSVDPNGAGTRRDSIAAT